MCAFLRVHGCICLIHFACLCVFMCVLVCLGEFHSVSLEDNVVDESLLCHRRREPRLFAVNFALYSLNPNPIKRPNTCIDLKLDSTRSRAVDGRASAADRATDRPTDRPTDWPTDRRAGGLTSRRAGHTYTQTPTCRPTPANPYVFEQSFRILMQ